MTNSNHFDISDKKSIERFGFEYSENESKCTLHRFNNVPINVDMRGILWMETGVIEKRIDDAFKNALRQNIKNSKIKKIRRLWWDRLFVMQPVWINTNPYWQLGQFTVRFWVRILSEDASTNNSTNHIVGV